MKKLLVIAGLILAASPSFAAQQEHACDKFALDTAASVFGPSRTSVAASPVIDLSEPGTQGMHITIKVELKGDIKGYVLVTTVGEGDSEDCNLQKINLSL
jgi:hypothetical protein